ncbi:hypothetical protein [Gracilibacillus alcaliphilus]|uniref:hypothetical protein n=1 Tax=Gracilibacillus alcaliphilus TaxID=1401441 RepID=UPI001955FB1B|nr:hypothetical protein [Gracilibacillus alcaliphilus]MBM7676620.1 hypothetical protein [Gracilibacillus alcaliphilus]
MEVGTPGSGLGLRLCSYCRRRAGALSEIRALGQQGKAIQVDISNLEEIIADK